MTLRIPLLLLLFFLASSLSAAEPVPTSRVTTTIGNRFLSIQVAHDRAWRSDQVTVPAKVSSTSVPHLTPATLRLQQGRLLPIAAHQGKTVSTDLQAAVTLATHPDEETAWGRLTRQVAVGLRADIDPETLWQQIGCQAVRELDWADAWIVEASGSDLLTAVELAETLRRHRSVRFAEVQIAWPWQRALTPDDPYFASDQWHINGDSPADMNVQSVWSSYTGAGVVIAIVDDGLQLDHPDLAANISAPHIDLNGNDTDPSPGPDDFHGVLVAGCAAAVGANEKGGLGVAPEAGLTGVRLIAAGFTDSENAEAFRHRLAPTAPTEPVSVSNNSWGTGDDGATIFSIGSLTKSALQRGVREGREGKGIVYVFASGNGNRDDASFDSSDYDIMQNQEEVLTIGALAPDDSIASYSEGGVNVFAVAPSGDSGRLKGIFATDRSGADGLVAERTVDGDTISGDYVLPDDDFPGDGVALDGTSFASPNAAGAIAILLEANPALTYRDVQHVLLQSMRRPAQTDSGWVRNSAGIHHHRRYGFGAIDVAAAVALAESWTPVRDLTPPATAGSGSVLLAIPDNNTGGVSHSIAVSSGTANMTIERVMLHVEIRHTWRGDLSYELTSPAGTTARIPFRTGDNNDNLDYIFCMLPFWGESPAGQWRLRVIDNQENDTGQLLSWDLRIIGAAVGPTVLETSVSRLEPDAGTTTLSLTGSGFTQDTTVTLPDGSTAEATVVSDQELNVTVTGDAIAAADNQDLELVVSNSEGSVTLGIPVFDEILPTSLTFTISGVTPAGVSAVRIDQTVVSTRPGERWTHRLSLDAADLSFEIVQVQDGFEVVRTVTLSVPADG